LTPGGVLLYLDEIQYFNKKQQQSLLEFMENGSITLIAATTENPYFYVYGAVLSRSTVFEFLPVVPEDLEPAVRRAFGICGDDIALEEGVVEHIAHTAGGDVRKAINAAELLSLSVQPNADGVRRITLQDAEAATSRSSIRYDRDGDEHYDLLSAFQKSIRGSDPHAAIHYLARLLAGGDIVSVCRRLMVIACEDIGLAYPQAMAVTHACVEMARQLGMPEAFQPLANAVILLDTSPKSNAAPGAYGVALADIQAGRSGPVPPHLKDTHYAGAAKLGRGGYVYPHDFPHHYTPQQYLPDAIKDALYYTPGDNKTEQAAARYWEEIKGKV
jgi:putative ATPase